MKKKCKKLVIETPRLMLRYMEKEDQENALDLLTNGQIGKTFMLPVFQTREEAIPLFEKLRRLSLTEERLVYGIYLEKNMIGFINDVGITETGVELGYCLHPKHHNKGFMTEALNAAIQELFRIGFSVVKAAAFEENIASLRVMEKCGMTETGEEETIEYMGENKRCIFRQIAKERGSEKTFIGISRTFSLKDEEQYNTIGAFWDEMSAIYGLENLQGVGYCWKNGEISYAIGLKNGEIEGCNFCMELPDDGWEIATGKTDNLKEIYDEIYQKSALDLEIESFFENGDCEIKYRRRRT